MEGISGLEFLADLPRADLPGQAANLDSIDFRVMRLVRSYLKFV
jgi:hypothetical protein